MLYISEKEVRTLLSMPECIDLMETTLGELSKGTVVQQLRSVMMIDGLNMLGYMPAYLQERRAVGAKLTAVFPKNYEKGLPSHPGIEVIFGTETGKLKAVVDSISITAIRTAAASGAATRALARKDASHLAILGAGQQGRTHLEAMCLVRDIKKVTVWDYYWEAAENFAREMREQYGVEIVPCKTVQDAVTGADIICTVTISKVPIISYSWLKSGVHINAVGSWTPDAREIDSETIQRASMFVDSKACTVIESGDYLIPLQDGVITEEIIKGNIGDVFLGNIPGRSSDDEITLYNAVGIPVEDLAAADYIYNKALEQGIGVHIDM